MDKATYLRFSGIDFTNFIMFVNSMNSRDKSKYSRVALIHVEDGKLICRAIDDIRNVIEYNVELYKSDNEITEPIAASVSDLSALIKSANSDKFTIRKCFNQYEFNVIGNGWMPFKTIDVNVDKFSVTGVETEIGKINSVKLRNTIASVLGYTQDYTYSRDKYIQFSKSYMIVTSRLSSVITADEFVEMTLHRDDAAMLKSLLKDNFELSIIKSVSDVEKTVFVGPKFKLAITASGIESHNVKYANDLNNYVKIDCDELYRLTTLSERYSASKHIIGMSIKNGKLNISIKNVLAAKHSSVVNSNAVGDVKDTSKEAEVSSPNLLKTLKLFQDKHSREVNIYITDEMVEKQNCILIFDENTQANINIYNR